VSRQSNESVEKNRRFFAGNATYAEQVGSLDTYARIRAALDTHLPGGETLLDIGNGGVFDYDVARAAKSVTALDLFADGFAGRTLPANVSFVQGSALDIPFPDASFDSIVIVMLIHHLVGASVAESRANVKRCFAECRRVLKPGGKIVVAESCVPSWFYTFERLVFRLAAVTVGKMMSHPVTLQYTIESLRDDLIEHFPQCTIEHVPKGRFVLQFGMKVPSVLTPVQVYILRAS
jgi:ubiquinone/menaquinone biosynthesis C-methylase UbiE